MSEVCRRGHKCMCFQCGERDCERYEPEPPKWIEKLSQDEKFLNAIKATVDQLMEKGEGNGME